MPSSGGDIQTVHKVNPFESSSGGNIGGGSGGGVNKAEVKASAAGEWQKVTLGVKMEESKEAQTVMARLEASEQSVRLRGILKVKAGEELKTGETLMTLPEGLGPKGKIVLYPSTSLAYIVGEINLLVEKTTGVVTLNGPLYSGESVRLDNLTFNLI